MKTSYICTSCGYVGQLKKKIKGSFFVELALWFFFLLPGLIYSLWRLTSGVSVCPMCENPSMIPTSTPRGMELIERQEKDKQEKFDKWLKS